MRPLLTSAWRVQPPYPTGIEWDNALAAGLKVAINPAIGFHKNLVGPAMTPVGPVAIVGGAQGKAGSWDRATANGLNTGYTPGTIASFSAFVLVSHRNLVNTNAEGYFSTRPGAAGNTGITFHTVSASGIAPNRTFTPRLTLQGVADYTGNAVSGFDNAYNGLAFSATSGSNVRFFAGGSFLNQVTIGAVGQNTQPILFGADGSGGVTEPLHADVALFLYWARRLSDDEQARIAVNPWRVFRRPSRPIYLLPGTGSFAGSLSATEANDTLAATGTVAIAGTASITEAASTLAATGIGNVASAAFGATASASTTSTGAAAANVIDGRQGGGHIDLTTVWEPDGTHTSGDWVQSLFATTYTIEQVVVYLGQTGNTGQPDGSTTVTSDKAPTGFKMQGWNGSTWDDLATWDYTATPTAIPVINASSITPYTTDRVRLLITSATFISFQSIAEIEAYGYTAGDSGTLAVTEADSTLSATGTAAIAGTASPTEADSTLSAAGTAAVAGSAAVTESDDTLSSAATAAEAGSAAVTEADDTTSAAATAAVAGTASVTESDDTLSADGLVAADAGTADITEADDTAAAAGTAAIAGTAAPTEADDTLAAAATADVAGTADVTEADDTAAAAGTVDIAGTADVTEGDDTLVAAGGATAGQLDVTEDDDTAAATGTVDVTGSADLTEGGDALGAAGHNDNPVTESGGGWSYKRKLRSEEIEELKRRARELARIVAYVEAGEPVQVAAAKVIATAPSQDRAALIATVESVESPLAELQRITASIAAKREAQPAKQPADIRVTKPGNAPSIGRAEPANEPAKELVGIAEARRRREEERIIAAALVHFFGDDVEMVEEAA